MVIQLDGKNARFYCELAQIYEAED